MRAKTYHVSAIFLLLLLGLVSGSVPPAFCSTTYTTNFSLTENPISENGKWIDGKTVGLDWANVRTSPGLAHGTQTDTIQYDDSTAILTGTWGPDQSAWATVHTVNQTSAMVEEVEIRLRTTISAHGITGYEVNFRCTADGSQYVQIVRWNGPLGNFTLVDSRPGPGLHNGDVVKAAISGSTITAYVNGTAIFSAEDSAFTTSSPGMGFYIQGGSAAQEGDYGFTSFAATDGSAIQATASTSSSGQTYATNFPLTENPISEGGKWINGNATGLDWGNVQTCTNCSSGTGSAQHATGTIFNGAPPYNDSTAVLSGTWQSNQSASAVVYIAHQQNNVQQEVELRLNTTIQSHSITGYEFDFSVDSTGGTNSTYFVIVRWNGALNSYCYLHPSSSGASTCDSNYAAAWYAGQQLNNGDVLAATSNGGTLRLYVNGVQKIQAIDTSYMGGSPGMGVWLNGGSATTSMFSNFGFSSFTASDSSTKPQGPAPPTNLKATVN